MTEEMSNQQQRPQQRARSVLTAATALTSLGSGPDQQQPGAQDEGGQASPLQEAGGTVALPPSPSSDEDKDDCGPQPSRRGRGNLEEDVPMTFPQRLMELLDNERYSDVISWLPHGKGFIIYQKKRFANEVLPRYFKQAKFTSFTRKLNRWGFQRVSRGAETGAYFHQYFQRGNLRLCMQMSCQSVNRSGGGGGLHHQGVIGRGMMGGAMDPLSPAMTGVLMPSMTVTQPPQQAQMCMSNAMADLCLQSPNPMMNQIQQQSAFNPAQISPSPVGHVTLPPGMGGAVPSQMSAPPVAAQTAQQQQTSSAFNPTQSLMRLQELQRQQEQLLMQQQQIKEQMQAVAQSLPQLSADPSPSVPPHPPLTASQQQQQQLPSPAPGPLDQQQQVQELLSQQQAMVAQQQQAMAAQQQQAMAAQQQQQQQSTKTPAVSPAGQPQQQQQEQQSNIPTPTPENSNTSDTKKYSQAVVNAAMDALQKSNTPAYLQMLVASQGKKEASAEDDQQGTAASGQAFQNQLHAAVRAQHEQLQQYRAAQQKLALSSQQSGDASAAQVQAAVAAGQMQAMAGLAAAGGMTPQRKDRNRSPSAKRASAA